MEAISELPRRDDIDADYSPQYVKVARLVRDKITSGRYRHGDRVPTAALAREHGVSARVTLQALAMLAANGYLARPGPHRDYRVTRETGTGRAGAPR